MHFGHVKIRDKLAPAVSVIKVLSCCITFLKGNLSVEKEQS